MGMTARTANIWSLIASTWYLSDYQHILNCRAIALLRVFFVFFVVPVRHLLVLVLVIFVLLCLGLGHNCRAIPSAARIQGVHFCLVRGFTLDAVSFRRFLWRIERNIFIAATQFV